MVVAVANPAAQSAVRTGARDFASSGGRGEKGVHQVNPQDTHVEELFVGHLTLDDTVLPDGTSHFDSPGGAALYAAAGGHLWVPRVGIISRIGCDYPREHVERFRLAGVDVSGIVEVERPNVHIWALYDRRGHRYFIPQVESGSYDDLAPRASEIPDCYLDGTRSFHVAPLPLRHQEDIVRYLSGKAKLLTIDPHHEWVAPQYLGRWQQLLSQVDVFLPSEDELIELLGIGKKLPDVDQYQPYLQQLAVSNLKALVLKLGERGVLLYDVTRKAFYHLPTVADRVVDVTGAGDAFCGGFLVGLNRTGDPLAAARWGTVSSSVVIENFGALAAFSCEREAAVRRLEVLTAITDQPCLDAGQKKLVYAS